VPLARFVPLFERIAEVVQTAHDAGIVHRDLKPQNVMVLTRAGRLLPKLLDFGIAKVLDAALPTKATPVEIPARRAMAETLDDTPAALGGIKTVPGSWTRAGSLIGSPPYMAPELWDGDEIDGRTDQYALAVMAYACLTGRLPFDQRALAE